jgi:hypothetical protein
MKLEGHWIQVVKLRVHGITNPILIAALDATGSNITCYDSRSSPDP